MTSLDDRFGHRVTYYSRRLEPVEQRRYTAEDGQVHVVTSAHATLTSVGDLPERRVGEQYTVHRAVHADGTECYVLKAAHRRGELARASSWTNEITYVHADESPWAAQHLYPTLEDALIYAGDPEARERENARLEEMLERATAAAAGVDGEHSREHRHRWSRAAYEAACAALGLRPEEDEHTRFSTSGVFTIPEYHAEHIVWIDLTRHRTRGIAAEADAAENTALARADQAAGTGPYSRAAYETACAAAGITALPDAVLPCVTADHYLADYADVRDVLGEMRSADLLGATPKTAAALAARREAGMTAEVAEQRETERRALAEQGTDFATPQQVARIRKLLAARAEDGTGGGFYAGPTDPGGIANLSRGDADLYILSLSEQY